MRARPYRRIRTDSTVDAAVARHGPTAESLLPVLQEIESAKGSLAGRIGATADALHLPEAHAYGVASFYSMLSTEPRGERVVRVCDGPVCALCGADAARQALTEACGDDGPYRVERTSCLGLCDRAPAALVGLEACGPLSAESAAELLDGCRGPVPSYAEPRAHEVRIAMYRIGKVNPEEIDDAISAGGYESLAKALQAEREQLLATVTESGLQGRGGAGFPTGRKWQLVADESRSPKYIICNADESEPAAFKDRVLMEGDPHLLIEGIALAAYAVGAGEGYIYIRGEYELAARRLERAIDQATQKGWLGKDIRGSGFSFHIHMHRGAGAYICGEETALLESLEGRRGEPRVRPPYPTTYGLYGRPTVVNNVETLCKVPAIVSSGAAWYRGLGTPHSPGTKVFTVSGHVRRPCAFEAPFGITLRQIIDDFGGGMRDGSSFKMALTGGAAGTIVGAAKLDVPLDFASTEQDIALGSGAILVMDESVSVVALLGWLLHFFEVESCGKCTPCREGTREARCVVDRLQCGKGRPADLEELRRLSRMLRLTSFCGLGQSVAWPVDSALAQFGLELETLT